MGAELSDLFLIADATKGTKFDQKGKMLILPKP
jgi:hypothetical protein